MDAYLDNHVIRLGRGEPLLLVHGIGHHKEGWDPVLPGLGARFDVAALDLPGFGGAPELDVTPTAGALTAWCEQVMDAMGWETAHIAGNSLGGLLALRLAGTGRARSVTALSPAGKALGWEDRWARFVLRAQRLMVPLAAGIPALSDTALGRRVALSLVFGKPARAQAGYARASMEGLMIATAFEETLSAIDWCSEDLTGVTVPVTIAWGTRDLLLHPRQGRRWAEAVPNSRLVKMAGLGHTPMPDDPAMIVDVIVRTAGIS